jgi:hypothetical protein
MKRFEIPGDGLLADGTRTLLALGEWTLERVVDAARRISRRPRPGPQAGAAASRFHSGEIAP